MADPESPLEAPENEPIEAQLAGIRRFAEIGPDTAWRDDCQLLLDRLDAAEERATTAENALAKLNEDMRSFFAEWMLDEFAIFRGDKPREVADEDLPDLEAQESQK